MGYYTHFELEIDDKDWDEKLENVLSDEGFSSYGPLIDVVTGDADDCKWYDYEEDMKELSKMFPDVLFTLKGAGEESGDLWVCYFKYGKMQRCRAKISYDEYNEDELV